MRGSSRSKQILHVERPAGKERRLQVHAGQGVQGGDLGKRAVARPAQDGHAAFHWIDEPALPDTALVELLDGPGWDRYRVRAEIRHELSNTLGGVGLYVGRQGYPRFATGHYSAKCG